MAAYRRERGAARVPRYRTKEGFALGSWLGTQRTAALDELGMDWGLTSSDSRMVPAVEESSTRSQVRVVALERVDRGGW